MTAIVTGPVPDPCAFCGSPRPIARSKEMRRRVGDARLPACATCYRPRAVGRPSNANGYAAATFALMLTWTYVAQVFALGVLP